ncbi:MAG: hypothetical protein ABIH82_06130 [Candidatus Woesearchaeota archaeon]
MLIELLGEDGLPLIKELTEKDNTSEFDLATKTKKDIKVIRRMLYILYNHNLVSFNRKKDKIKGWYIYYWTLLPESIKYLYFKNKKERLLKVKIELEGEIKELFFICPTNCVRLNFDQAMDIEFHCPECGELVSQDSGEKIISALQKEIKALEGDLTKENKSRVVKALSKKKLEDITVEKPLKKTAVKKKIVKTNVKKKISTKTAPKNSPKKKTNKPVEKKVKLTAPKTSKKPLKNIKKKK